MLSGNRSAATLCDLPWPYVHNDHVEQMWVGSSCAFGCTETAGGALKLQHLHSSFHRFSHSWGQTGCELKIYLMDVKIFIKYDKKRQLRIKTEDLLAFLPSYSFELFLCSYSLSNWEHAFSLKKPCEFCRGTITWLLSAEPAGSRMRAVFN